MFDRLGDHPMVRYIMQREIKPKGKYFYNKKQGKNIWCPDNHLSERDIGIRPTRNFSVQGGYTKNKDGAPRTPGGQMTHAWLEVTDGRRGQTDGGRHNLEMTANLLAEICGFQFPFKAIFDDEGLQLHYHTQHWRPKPPPTLPDGGRDRTSAVGDGDVAKAMQDSNRMPSSSNQTPAENVPPPLCTQVLPPMPPPVQQWTQVQPQQTTQPALSQPSPQPSPQPCRDAGASGRWRFL